MNAQLFKRESKSLKLTIRLQMLNAYKFQEMKV